MKKRNFVLKVAGPGDEIDVHSKQSVVEKQGEDNHQGHLILSPQAQ